MAHDVIHLNGIVKKELFQKKLDMVNKNKRDITWDEFFIKSHNLPIKLSRSGRGNKIE